MSKYNFWFICKIYLKNNIGRQKYRKLTFLVVSNQFFYIRNKSIILRLNKYNFQELNNKDMQILVLVDHVNISSL